MPEIEHPETSQSIPRGKEGLIEEEKRDELKYQALGLFQELFSSDEDILNGEVNEKGIEAIDLESDSFPQLYSKLMVGKFQAHDEGNYEEAYLMTGLERAMTFTHIPLEERIEAGFSYVDALIWKDEAEIYSGGNSGGRPKPDSEEMYQQSNLNYDEITVEWDEHGPKVEFDLDDLDDDQRNIYESFRNEYEKTVGEFFKEEVGDERAAEMVERGAKLEFMAWHLHKVGGEVRDDPEVDFHHNYNELMSGAINLKMKAALNRIDYPSKDRHGKTGLGIGPQKYSTMVEEHDRINQSGISQLLMDDAENFASWLNIEREKGNGV